MRRLFLFSLVCLFGVGCGESGPADVEDTDDTTPSDIPGGTDLPPIPRPQAYLDETPNQSEVVTTIEVFDGDSAIFTPSATLITGSWRTERYATLGGTLGNEVSGTGSCRHTVHNGVTARSEDLRFSARRIDPCVNPLNYGAVDYPGQGARVNGYLRNNPRRVRLLQRGMPTSPTLTFTIESGRHQGHARQPVGLREVCDEDPPTIPQGRCYIFLYMDVEVETRPLTNPVYLKRERFWQKAGSQRFQGSAGVTQTSVAYSYTSGSSSTETESFAYTIGGEIGAPIKGLTAKVSGSITNTFTSSSTVTESATVTETWSVTIDEDDDVVFEVWSLVERYTFVNEDGTPYEDPDYTFSLPSLTNASETGQAFVSTSFAPS